MFWGLFNKKKKENTSLFLDEENDDLSKDFDDSFNYTTNMYKMNTRNRDTEFSGIVLLKDTGFDFDELSEDLLNMWFIDKGDRVNNDGKHVFKVGTMLVRIGLVEIPIEDQELEIAAIRNYMWSEAIEKVREHKAYLTVSVFGDETPHNKGILFTKIVDACCDQESAIGVYMNDTVYKVSTYKDFADILDADDDTLPILNLIWIGFRRTETGYNMFTRGMKSFGREDMEIIDSPLLPNTLHNAMLDIVNYVLENDIFLSDGELLDTTAEHKWEITRSEGVSLTGTTFKVKLK